ncbi:MAG: hypothetical protein CMH30_02045 [Micavibrio sp.]|nr:hypothetical protein [Micavibrio sp.]
MIIYQNKDFSENVSHGFFGRQGGVSRGIFESLNVGQGSIDEKANVKENRLIVAQAIGAKELTSLYQIHSADCLYIKGAGQDRPKADAMVTDKPDLALTILTADCAPVLFEGQKADGSTVIGAAHAGWGGAFKGVLDNTVAKMIEIGAEIETIKASIGPCIGQNSYEVGDEYYDRFLEQDKKNAIYFKKVDKWHFDLPKYCQGRLSKAGVKAVDISGIDTYEEDAKCFSYRRKTHKNEEDYGRQASVIMIKA